MLCKSLKERDLFMLNDKDYNSYKDLIDNPKFKSNIKYDGERCLIVKKGNKVYMINRGENLINKNFKEIENDLKKLDFDFTIDGEIISFDDDFNKLQQRALTKDKEKIKDITKKIKCKYMIFDILSYKEIESLKQQPLNERLEFLRVFDERIKQVSEIYHNPLLSLEVVKYENVLKCYERAKKEKREGIIVKDMDSFYKKGRSNDWLKVKFFKETTINLISYTKNNKGFRCEDKEKNAVQIFGDDGQTAKDFIKLFGSCEVNIQYLEKTKNNRFRQPTFKGFIINNIQYLENDKCEVFNGR